MSQLKLSGDASGTGIVTVAAPNTNSTYTVTLPAAAGTIVTGAAGSTTQVQYNNAGAFGGSANFVWDNSNVRLGIGTASPAVTFEVDKASGEALRVAATSANQSIYSRYLGGSPSVADFYVGVDSAAGGITGVSAAGMLWNAGNAGLAFGTNNTLKMSINADGTIKTSSTISVGNATPSTSGAGITFPATQSASTDANTLDDYEEGTWTPTIISTATNPTVSYNTNGQRGYYTKIGRVVYFQAFLAVSSISSGSGDLVCGGLPFTVGGDVGTLRTWGNIVVGTSGVNWGTGKTALAGYARGGETSIYVLAMQNDTSWGGIPIGNVANGDEMVWSGWYQV